LICRILDERLKGQQGSENSSNMGCSRKVGFKYSLSTLPLFYLLLSCETWLKMMTSFPVMNQIQLLSCFVKLRINRALLRKGFSQFSFKMAVFNNTLWCIITLLTLAGGGCPRIELIISCVVKSGHCCDVH